MAESQGQGANERQAAATGANAPQCVDVSTIGVFHVAVGEEQSIPVPNPFGRPPTRVEIFQALIAAGHLERADELADKAYAQVFGTD